MPCFDGFCVSGPARMKLEHIYYWIRRARDIGQDDNPCYSRHIGVVVVDPATNKIKSSGTNGPPRGTLHTDEYEYLERHVWPLLTEQERSKACTEIMKKVGLMPAFKGDMCQHFAKTFEGCKTCPRRLLDIPSGQRLELCSCAHAEANAVTGVDVSGCWMICACGIPCQDCCKAIIAANITTVHCLEREKDYSFGSRLMLEKAGIEAIIHKESDVWPNEKTAGRSVDILPRLSNLGTTSSNVSPRVVCTEDSGTGC
jgi:deoxycytidylate deaminase